MNCAVVLFNIKLSCVLESLFRSATADQLMYRFINWKKKSFLLYTLLFVLLLQEAKYRM